MMGFAAAIFADFLVLVLVRWLFDFEERVTLRDGRGVAPPGESRAPNEE